MTAATRSIHLHFGFLQASDSWDVETKVRGKTKDMTITERERRFITVNGILFRFFGEDSSGCPVRYCS
jgi:hypothetical protein